MNTEDALARADAALRERRAALSEALESGAEAARPVELDQTRVGRVSRIDAMQQQAMSAETNRRLKLDLKRVEAALARVADGSYGECLRCGSLIAGERLDFDPAAPLCIGCAEASGT